MTARHPLSSPIFWIGVAGLILVVHWTENLYGGLARVPADYVWIGRLKAVAFVFGLAVVCLPLLEDLRRLRPREHGAGLLRALGVAAVTMVLLGLLSFYPHHTGMGWGYAWRSLAPFDQPAGWCHKRLLMPSLAYFLGFRGERLFFVFGLLMTLLLLALLWRWLRRHAPLSYWQFVSLGTSTFVLLQFQCPGYPDALVFLLLLLAMSGTPSATSRLVFLFLALLGHEASVAVGIVIAWRWLPRRHVAAYLAMIGLYALAWLASQRFDIAHLMAAHHVEGLSAIEWIALSPQRQLLGLTMAFKALWLLPVIAVAVAHRHGLGRDAAFIVLVIAAGVLLTFLGIDTSRMVSFAFPAILVSLRVIHGHLEPGVRQRVLALLFLANLLIPSYYVELDLDNIFRPGLYELYCRHVLTPLVEGVRAVLAQSGF